MKNKTNPLVLLFKKLMALPRRRFAVWFALLALLGINHEALAQSDNFNDGDDTNPVFWDLIDSVHAESGGASTPNIYDPTSFQYHLSASPSPNPGLYGPARTAALPPVTPYNFTNFYVSVDVVAWDNSIFQAFGLVARGKEFGTPKAADGYLFGYANAGAASGTSYIKIVRMDNELSYNEIVGSGGNASMNVTLDPAKDYRFVFMGRGTHLEGRVYELPNLVTPIAVVSGNTAGDSTILTSGQAGLLAYNIAGPGSSAVGWSGGCDLR